MTNQVGDVLHKKRKTKKRRIKGRFRRPFVVIVILLYFASRMPPFFSQATNKSYVAEFGKIETIVSTEGYIVRDEKVVKSFGGGEINLLVSEGEKVSRGQKIASLHFDDLDEKTTKDLEIINLRIEKIKDKQSQQQVFHKDVEKIDADITAVSREIQELIKNEEYEKINLSKEILKELVDKKSIISGERSFAGTNLEQLERQQKSLQEKVDNSIEIVYSEFPGIIALGSDELEEILTLKNIEELTIENFQTVKNTYKSLNPKASNKEKDNHIRIINNHRWSIITQINEEEIQGLKVGKTIKIRQRGDNKEYNAVIRKINHKDGEDAIIIMDVTEFMESFYNQREIIFDIIKTSYEGIMIPNTSIVEKEGQNGVYRIDINGISKFVPIKVKGSNREYSIVYHGYFEENKEDDSIRVNTINFYDEIVVNGEKVNEGTRIAK